MPDVHRARTVRAGPEPHARGCVERILGRAIELSGNSLEHHLPRAQADEPIGVAAREVHLVKAAQHRDAVPVGDVAQGVHHPRG
jgi:hypothetical protein